MATTPPSTLSHVLETCLYVRSVPEAAAWYERVLGLKPYLNSERIAAFALGPTTLLLFALGRTATDVHLTATNEHGTIPGHGPTPALLDLLASPGSSLKQHFCLAVRTPEEVDSWEKWFKDEKVRILGGMNWGRGGRSVYFEDLDGNVGEVGSRGIWAHY